VRSSCPSLKKPASYVPHASSKHAAVIESSSNATITPTAGGGEPGRQPFSSAPVSMKVDGATKTDTGQEINQVTVSLTGEIISERETERPTPLRDIVTYKDACTLSTDDNVDDNVATSVCCPVAQLSTLTYIDVTVRCSEDSLNIAVRALSDTGAQVSIIKAELLDGSMEVIGRMRLQPFCGNAVEADWIKLQISPFTEDHDNNTYITVSMKVDGATNTDTGQEINQVTVSLTDEIISERETKRPTPLRDIVTYKDACTVHCPLTITLTITLRLLFAVQ